MILYDIIAEARVPRVRDQIIADVQKHGGSPDQYFVRFTDVDRLGFSDRQKFKRHYDVDNPKFQHISTGVNDPAARRALWFYPLAEYLKISGRGLADYAMDMPYAWLVKIKPTAWLQPVDRDQQDIKPAPQGRERVGLLKSGMFQQAVFFAPAFDVVGRYYDYAGQHQRHGEVKGRPEPSFFDRVRGAA